MDLSNKGTEKGGSSDEESDDEISAEIKLKRLLDRKEELIENLNGIDASLAKLGYQVDNLAVKEAKRQLQSGIRMKNKLSFRGEEMCKEYFTHLDEDNDGFLVWEDFRAMRTLGADFEPELGGLNHYPEYSNWESWRMYMKDLGVQCDRLGRVNLKEFTKYRAIVEPKQPLARELDIVRLGYLPQKLALWRDINLIMKEVLEDLPERSRREAEEGRGLAFEDVQYILCNLGITYTRPEFLALMEGRAQLENLHESLTQRFLKQRYQQSPARFASMLESGNISQRAILLTVDHMKYTKLHKLSSWIFSDRPAPKCTEGLYHDLLVGKYRAHRQIRFWDKVTKVMFSIGYQIRQRRVFDDFRPINKLTPQEAIKSTAGVEIEIQGSGGNVDGGLSLEWSSMNVDHPETFNLNHKLPRESGASLILEFMVKPDAKDEDVEHLSQRFISWLKSHFDKELKKNVQFRGLFCFPAHSEGDGCKVIRLALCYKRIVSFDAWFTQMLIPYSLTELLCSLNGALKLNLGLGDIFSTTSNFQLDTMLSGSFELGMQYRALPILNICERLKLALSAGYTTHQTRPDSEDANEILRRKLREYYPKIVEAVTYTESVVKGQKGVGLKFVFKKLSDLLSKIGSANTAFNQIFPEAIGSQQRYMTDTFIAWQTSILKQYHAIFDPLAAILRGRVDDEEKEQAKSMREMMYASKVEAEANESTKAKAKSEGVMDKLKMLGIEMDEDDVAAEDEHDPASLILNATNRLTKADIAAMEVVEESQNVLIGLHSVQLLLGSFKLNVGIQGLDFMETLPKFPSMKDVKAECDERRKNLQEKSAAKRKEERMKRLKAKEEEAAKALAEQRRKERELLNRD